MQSNGSLRDKVQEITRAHFSAETERTKSKMATTERKSERGEGRIAHVGAAQVRIRITAALAPLQNHRGETSALHTQQLLYSPPRVAHFSFVHDFAHAIEFSAVDDMIKTSLKRKIHSI